MMMADTWALECMTYLTTGMVDARGRRLLASRAPSARCTGARRCWRVVNEALQIAAGIGYMADYPYERLLRDARINLVFEGTNEILRALHRPLGDAGPGRGARGRGAGDARAHQGLRAAQRLRHPQGPHRARPRAPDAPPPRRSTARPSSSRSTCSELARVVDEVLRRHGRDIAEMQYTQKRTADMAIDLYAIACLHLPPHPRHRAARRGGRAPRDRPHEHLRHRRREAPRSASSPPSTRTTTSCARPSPARPTSTGATPSTWFDAGEENRETRRREGMEEGVGISPINLRAPCLRVSPCDLLSSTRGRVRRRASSGRWSRGSPCRSGRRGGRGSRRGGRGRGRAR